MRKYSVLFIIIVVLILAAVSLPGRAELVKEYWDNGNLKVEAQAFNGKYEGPIKWYTEGGILFREGEYVNGRENGVFKDYYANGNVMSSGEMRNGLWHGVVNHYYADGSFKMKYLYENHNFKGYSISPRYINNPEPFVALYKLKTVKGEEVILKVDYKPETLKVIRSLFYYQGLKLDGMHKNKFLSREGNHVIAELLFENGFITNTKLKTDFRPPKNDDDFKKTLTVLDDQDREIIFTFMWDEDGKLEYTNISPAINPFEK